MNINPTVYSAYQANRLSKSQAGGRYQAASGEHLETAAEKTDRLSLSQVGSSQRDVGKVVRSIMQEIRSFDEQEAPVVVEQLQRDVATGSYQVSSQDLADAILGRVFEN